MFHPRRVFGCYVCKYNDTDVKKQNFLPVAGVEPQVMKVFLQKK